MRNHFANGRAIRHLNIDLRATLGGRDPLSQYTVEFDEYAHHRTGRAAGITRMGFSTIVTNSTVRANLADVLPESAHQSKGFLGTNADRILTGEAAVADAAIRARRAHRAR